MSILRVRQGAVTRVLPNAGSGRCIPKHFPISLTPIKQFPYAYVNDPRPHPAEAGHVYNQSGEDVLSISSIDANGENNYNGLSVVRAGDTITIGTQSAIITVRPTYVGGAMWSLIVNSWPPIADGNYNVSITRV